MQRVCFLVAISMAFVVGAARADFSDGVIKIGVLTDLSGPYAAPTGQGSVLAAQMAVEDFDAAKKGMKVELVAEDHKNKPDVGSEIAKRWYDNEKVDVIVDVPGSAVALAVSQITREKNKVFLASGAASSDLTGKACSPNTIHWTYDTWALANATGSVTVLSGGKTWYFITADYVFGQLLEGETEAAVLRSHGDVLGKSRYPFPGTTDFVPLLKQAQASKAKIIGMANAGTDTINLITQAAKLNLRDSGQQLAGLLLSDTDIHTLGLEKAQGLLLTTPFYWDLTPLTRTWSKRFFEKHKAMPTFIQAGVYSSVLHYLRAAEALRSDDGLKVVAKMKEMTTTDPLFGYGGRIRADGRKTHKLYLFEVKKPSESRQPWDYFKLRGIIQADTAFRPMKEGGCALVK